jgi:predicted  nucleic acid-binding Zn-ribbon protein
LYIADGLLAEKASFEKQISAFQIGKDERQTRREAIQHKVKRLQEELQHLDKQDKTDDGKAIRLQSEYRSKTEQWRETQKALEDRLSAAISP